MIGKAKTAKAGRQTNGARAMVNAPQCSLVGSRRRSHHHLWLFGRARFSRLPRVRSETNEDRILFYGREGVLVHEELLTAQTLLHSCALERKE